MSMGGDEFLVIIENATMLDILYVYETKDFTFGIIYKTETMSMEQAYKFADKEMYLKKERKN
jgi:GGDEF domain-containing protein